jgi:myosin heavy subunit
MKDKTKTFAGTIIIVLLLITTTIALISNAKNKRNYNEEKSLNESVTSQKHEVSQELDKVKNDLAALASAKASEEKELAETNSKLAETQKRILYMSKETSSLMNDKNELVQLQRSKSELDRVYEDLKLKQESSSSRIKELENSLMVLDAQKKEISADLAYAEKYRTDNVEIYGSRGNKKNKITFIGRRTNKLNISFDVPQSLTEPISFKIITPEGKTITPDDKSLTWLIKPGSDRMTASLSTIPGDIETIRKASLTYSPEEKLKSGEYKIQFFSNGKNIGNYGVMLR